MNENEREKDKIIKKVLEDPLLLQRLSEKVYELMKEDFRNQSERINYRKLL